MCVYVCVCVSVYVCSDNAAQPLSPLPVVLTDDDVCQKFFTSVVSALPPVSGTSLVMELRKRISGLLVLASLCAPAGRTHLHNYHNKHNSKKIA